jgi:hypothetical protein
MKPLREARPVRYSSEALMDIFTGHIGWIEIICGPMFSGKSEELIRLPACTKHAAGAASSLEFQSRN